VMPKTRALIGDRGTTFTNSIVSTPLCCPSRATFLTGQYVHNHGVLMNGPPRGGYAALDHGRTLATWLTERGIHTAHVGKYLNRYGIDSPPEVPPGWQTWFGLVDPATYRMYGYKVSDGGEVVTYGDRPEDYQTDVLARKAEEIIRGTSGPLFLSVAPLAPHLENSDETGKGGAPRPAPRHQGAFANEPLPGGPGYNEANVRDKPAHIKRLRRLTPAEINRLKEIHRGRLASLLALDDLVERVVKTLEETGRLGRTTILFTSDNGFFLGEHRLPDGKYYPYEEALRVPLLIRGPSFPAGRTATQPVSNIDLAPTILQLTGTSADREQDGRSLIELAQDPDAGKDRVLLVEGFGRNRNQVTYTGIRTPRWFYIEYQNGDREFYDLENDPRQLQSLHRDRSLAPLRFILSIRLDGLRTCAGEGCQ
jgi:N-acetylglucosamine-6-sulfatase